MTSTRLFAASLLLAACTSPAPSAPDAPATPDVSLDGDVSPTDDVAPVDDATVDTAPEPDAAPDAGVAPDAAMPDAIDTTDALPTADAIPTADATEDAVPDVAPTPDAANDADVEAGPDGDADAFEDAAPDAEPDVAPPPCVSDTACDDGNACTVNTCDPTVGCVASPVTCDDGDACTTDSCDALQGCVAAPISCDDGDACTIDSCNPATGCTTTVITCDDNNACTTDTCNSATGCTTTPVDCDDGVPCTVDSCDASTGCSNTGFDDVCDDGNPCTSDACQNALGCTNTLVGACLDGTPTSEPQYVGVWQDSDNARLIYRDQTWTQMTDTWDAQNDNGYRLIDLEPRLTPNGTRYDTIYEQRTGGYGLYVTSNLADFTAQQTVWSSLQMVDYETWLDGNGTQQYAAVYLGAGDYELHQDLSWDDFLAMRTSMHAGGYRLVDMEVLQGDTTTYSGLFQAGSGNAYLWVGSRWERFAAKVNEIDGMKLVDVEVYGPADKPRYAGVWLGNSTADRLVGGQPWTRFQALDSDHQAKGRQLVDLERFEGTPVTPVPWAASLWDQFGSVAVGYGHALAKDGQLIGYGGFGDRRATWESSGAGADFRPTTRTHLASVSKIITATAMVVAGIDFDQPFYPLLADQFPNAGDGVATVTIRQLVTHTSNMDDLGLGGKRCGPDFAGTVSNLIAADVLGAPGPYDYSNTNFCIARAVLEAVTGQDFVTWVNQNMFNPMGIYDFTAAPDTDHPTLYYRHDGAQVVEEAGYLWTTDYTPEAGAYGWYGSSVGLVRWLIGLRNHTVLTKTETDTMFAENLGWLNTSTSEGTAKWHNGGWGTGDGRGLKTAVVRFPGGYDGVILINTRPNPAKDSLKAAFEALIAWD